MKLWRFLAISALVVSIYFSYGQPAAALFSNPLTLGSEGKEVSLLQTFLKTQGYFNYPDITSYFGPVTRDSLISFEKEKSLEPDGIADKDTVFILVLDTIKFLMTKLGSGPHEEVPVEEVEEKMDEDLLPPNQFSAKSTSNSISISWNKVKEADSYNIKREDDGEFKTIGSSEETSYKDSTVKAGRSYTYVVTSVRDDEESENSSELEASVPSAGGGIVADPAATITSASASSTPENATLAHALTADESVTWSLAGGADQARFELSGATLRWASNGTKDYESPNDADTNNIYIVTVRATDTGSNTTDQTISVTVTDVDDTAPTITSSNSTSTAENTTLAHTLTANESVSWSLIGGADEARFELSGATLRWVSNGTKDYESPNDADTNNTYVVTVRATDSSTNTTEQTITVTVTDVDDFADPSYWNTLATGDRTSSITITSNATIAGGTLSNLVDGAFASNTTDSMFFGGLQSSREIVFDFATPKTVDGFRWLQDRQTTHGTWVMEGSSDNSSYTQLGSSFTLGASSGFMQVFSNTNTTAYRYYRLRQTAGTNSSSPWIQEIEFSISDPEDDVPQDAIEAGDRTSLITIGGTMTYVDGTATNLIDGAYVANATDATDFTHLLTTRTIVFDLGSGNSKIITGFQWLQASLQSHGTWVIEGSSDDSSYTQLGSSFTFGGALVQTQTFANSTAYRYYRLNQTSGSTSGSPWLLEVLFRTP